MRHLQSLTPLRGLAALTVLIYHLTRSDNDPTLPEFFLRGYLGVDLFFVLSGFVLTHVYLDAFITKTSWRSVGAFLWVRLARIYPVHFFVIAVMLAAGGGAALSAIDVAGNFLLLQVPLAVVPINQSAWSLSAEWQAYLVFPFIVAWLWRCNEWLAATIAFALIVVLDLLIVGSFRELRGVDHGWIALVRAWPEFVIGILTYRAFCHARAARLWRGDAALFTISAALILAFEFVPNDGVIVALFPPLLLAAVSNEGRAARLLNAAPLRLMGDISYSVYLGQTFAFSDAVALARTPLGATLGLGGLRLLTVLLALATGFLIHRCVEVPCRNLIRGMSDQLNRLATHA